MDADAELTAKEVCEGLKIKPQKLGSLVKQGLPCSGKGKDRRFNEHEVEQWLIENGLAELGSGAGIDDDLPESNIADAVRKCAQIMGRTLHRRTFCEWMKEPGFPGRPGRHGRANDGHFPCHAIVRWRDGKANQGKTSEEKTERETLLRIRRESEQFDLEKKRGEHLPIAFFEQVITRIVQSVTPIDDLPDIIAGMVPQDVAATVREAVQLQVKQVRTSIAAQIEQAVKGRNPTRK
jgi:phage terminase Nu1 subunit (DNA packaging protein)